MEKREEWRGGRGRSIVFGLGWAGLVKRLRRERERERDERENY